MFLSVINIEAINFPYFNTNEFNFVIEICSFHYGINYDISLFLHSHIGQIFQFVNLFLSLRILM